MEFYLKTKEEYDTIVENNDAFYRADRVVEGQEVAIYDYRLASISDFVDNEAFEMRGLCFVKNSEGKWERNILMNKFFNYSQTIGWMPEDLDNKKIIRVQDKLDGSIISFVKFSNGKVRAKSKTSFESDQAKMAQEFFDNNKNLQKYIEYCLNRNLVPIFELIGYENTIVLNYDVPYKLVLLQIRREDGTYLEKDEMISLAQIFDIEVAEDYKLFTLKDLLEKKETDEGYEGFVVTFEDSQMAKIKLDWYLSLHGLIGPDAFRENLLVKTILDGNIDDVISALAPGGKKDKIIEMQEKVTHKFNHLVLEFKSLRGSYYNEFSENRKEFAIKNSKHPLFGYVMKSIGGSFRDVESIAEEQIKLYILNKTNSLGKAKEWVNDL